MREMRTYANRQARGRTWKIWDLDAEMRYWPVLDALPPGQGPICEIGSGAAGLSSWTERSIIGVDPGSDERHGELVALPNLTRVIGNGARVPLEDESVSAVVAVDTFEHIPSHVRASVVTEMIRVTERGGRVIIIGPTGPGAAEADRWLLRTLRNRGPAPYWAVWLEEHVEMGVPSVDEMRSLLDNPRVSRVRSAGYLNLTFWRVMHLAAMSGLRLGPAHAPVWGSFARVARRFRRAPFYRWMFVADLT